MNVVLTTLGDHAVTLGEALAAACAALLLLALALVVALIGRGRGGRELEAMRAECIADNIVKAVNDTAFDLIVSNFANADMVGHSGKLEPTIRACEAIDAQLGRVYKAVKERNGAWLITADHDNAELMVDPVTGGPHTAHTTNPVPLIYIAEDAPLYRLRPDGSLRDISPTLLNILQLGLPKEMTGGDLRVSIAK